MSETKFNWYGDRVLAEIRGATPEALFEAGEQLLKAATAKAPQSTGHLRGSGYVSTTKRSTYRNEKTYRKETKPKDDSGVVVGFAAFYARFVEAGTKKRAARPFLRPAFDESKAALGAKVAESIRRKVDK